MTDADSMGVRVWRETVHWSLQDEAKTYYVTGVSYPDDPACESEPGKWYPEPVAEQMARVIAAAKRYSNMIAAAPEMSYAPDFEGAMEDLIEDLAALDAMTTTPEAS